MEIGIIGIGTLTLEVARRATKAGYSVIINNPKGNALIRDILPTIGTTVILDTIEKASAADIVFLFTSKEDLQKVLQNLPDMTGKIVIHTSSLIYDPSSLLKGISNAMTYTTTASLLPTAHVIKIFNPIQLDDKTSLAQKGKDSLFLISDHKESKRSIKTFLNTLNYSVVDVSSRFKQHSEVVSLFLHTGEY